MSNIVQVPIMKLSIVKKKKKLARIEEQKDFLSQ